MSAGFQNYDTWKLSLPLALFGLEYVFDIRRDLASLCLRVLNGAPICELFMVSRQSSQNVIIFYLFGFTTVNMLKYSTFWSCFVPV